MMALGASASPMLHAELTVIGTLQQSRRDGRRIVPAEIPSRPLAGVLEGLFQRLGEPQQALAARERWRDHPGTTIVVAGVLQLWQHAGAHERRLAAARCAEQQDEAFGIVVPPPVQDVDDLIDLLVPAEKDGAVVLGERLEAGIGAFGQLEVLLVQAFLLEPVKQPLEGLVFADFADAGKADELLVFEEVRDLRGVPPSGSLT